jgi:hypothetical protein
MRYLLSWQSCRRAMHHDEFFRIVVFAAMHKTIKSADVIITNRGALASALIADRMPDVFAGDLTASGGAPRS